jgi:site-specific DNA-methyltransferase (adenine-specific)
LRTHARTHARTHDSRLIAGKGRAAKGRRTLGGKKTHARSAAEYRRRGRQPASSADGEVFRHGAVRLRREDCFDALARLADGSIDALIADPPFAITNCAWDKALDWPRWWNLVDRKLKPMGVCALFACGKFTNALINSNPDWYRYDLVWEKTKAAGFLWSRQMPLRAHETILIFAPNFVGTAYNAQKTGRKRRRRTTKRVVAPTDIYHGQRGQWTAVDDGTRHPRSVLKFASVTGSAGLHPTQKPLGLMEWLVKTYSNPGDLVVDPFFGSGTTAVACAIHGRRFFGCESSRRFFNVACRRMGEWKPDKRKAA